MLGKGSYRNTVKGGLVERITRKEQNLLGWRGDGNLIALTLHSLVCHLLMRF